MYDTQGDKTLKTPEGVEFVLKKTLTKEQFTAIRCKATTADGTVETTEAYTNYVATARQAYTAEATAKNPSSLIFFVSILLVLLISMSTFRSPAVALMPDVTIKPDYLDKVIGNSISDPICAVLQLYYNHTQDERSITMMNLIRYGTSDETEIWLLKYGFSMDDMEWLVPCIESINEECIVFNSKIDNLNDTQKESISRYI